MKKKDRYAEKYAACPLNYSLTIIGGKWRLPIIWALSQNGILRYNALKRNIEGITNMMLTQSLKELEYYGVIIRKQYQEIPPRVEYYLSKKGEELIPTLKLLARWGNDMKHIHEKE